MANGKIRTFEDLGIWRIAKELAKRIYSISSVFPKEETFGMTSQVKRAALSVPSNMAEGYGRFHYLDRAKFFINARGSRGSRGSLFDLRRHLLIAIDLGFIKGEETKALFETIDDLAVKINNLVSITRRQAHKNELK